MEVGQWLHATRAAEVMIRDVSTLAADQSLADAVGMFLEEEISGAPVVDPAGACVGVLSVSDVLGADQQVDQEKKAIAESPFWSSDLALPASIYLEKLNEVRDKLGAPAARPVHQFMTTELISVTEDDALVNVAQKMVAAHVHRMIVVGEQNHLRGLISTIDVMAALLRAGQPPDAGALPRRETRLA